MTVTDTITRKSLTLVLVAFLAVTAAVDLTDYHLTDATFL